MLPNASCLLVNYYVQADFGRPISSLGSQSYPLVAASPLLACTALQSSIQGAVVLIQRGAGCLLGLFGWVRLLC